MDNNLFQKFIQTIALSAIQPSKIEFERLGEIPNGEDNVQISWKMIYSNETPFLIVNDVFQLAPMFEITISCQNKVIYSHKTIFFVSMNIINKQEFNEIWANEEIQRYFKEKQIGKTLWPIVRQQVLDGMTRLSLPPVSLPWII